MSYQFNISKYSHPTHTHKKMQKKANKFLQQIELCMMSFSMSQLNTHCTEHLSDSFLHALKLFFKKIKACTSIHEKKKQFFSKK